MHEQLTTTLQELEKQVDTNWLQKLDDRKKAEIKHHNTQRDTKHTENLPQDTFEMLHGNKKFYSTVEKSVQYKKDWLKESAKGKVFLDYACGDGAATVQAALDGASLAIGIDISDVSIQNARKKAEDAEVGDQCFFIQGDCENTGLPSNSIDVLLCCGMLHHLDLSFAFPEIRRILKPGGKALAIEALNYNPLIKLYRQMTPSMRTEWEKNHILSHKDLRFAERFFDVKNVRYWHLFSVAAVFFRKNKSLKNSILKLLNGMDDIILKIPGLRLMSWQFTFELRKPS